ncbi:DNA polymerase III subunit delta [Flavobacterium silvaticum]|uniref:DNA polymerase III subunit delta n=1 Tax=Flavobacterium silvaticum TaxID=1852020 RepID=A0A972JHC6_9FLAO|nr:DNA polymerase III subunit delta [Flavobacterium silvaticum]NMH29096.1 DNA polymerase III subunit delta [Flavobacterium silvaticum]
MEEAAKIVSDIKAGKVKPLYLLMGEEPYYIDKISEYLENNLLAEEEKGFNQTVVYGRDTSVDDIVSSAKRYPMMAERQLVVVKEAQELVKTFEKFEAYADNPTPSTVLVICYKYKTVDKRKKVLKNFEKNGVVFDSAKLRDYQVSSWIERVLKGRGYGIEPKACAMLAEFLGTDLSKISNEMDKLALVIPKGNIISTKDIQENIGFSKDYNVFELRKALGEANRLKAYQIAKYFADNPKDNPMVVTTSLVFQFFVQLLQYHGLKDKKTAASVLKVSPYFIKDYEMAARNYPMKKVSGIVNNLRKIDIRSKGVGASLTNGDLLKEMLIGIFD